MQRKTLIRALTIIVCLYLIVTTVQAIADLWKAGDKELERQHRLSALEAQQRLLLAQKNLAQKPEYWEKIARDALGMAKKGEETLIIPDDLLKEETKVVVSDIRPNWRKWLDLLL